MIVFDALLTKRQLQYGNCEGQVRISMNWAGRRGTQIAWQLVTKSRWLLLASSRANTLQTLRLRSRRAAPLHSLTIIHCAYPTNILTIEDPTHSCLRYAIKSQSGLERL